MIIMPSVAINPEIRMGLSLETLLCCNIVGKNLFIKDTKSTYVKYDDLQKLDYFQRVLKITKSTRKENLDSLSLVA